MNNTGLTKREWYRARVVIGEPRDWEDPSRLGILKEMADVISDNIFDDPDAPAFPQPVSFMQIESISTAKAQQIDTEYDGWPIKSVPSITGQPAP